MSTVAEEGFFSFLAVPPLVTLSFIVPVLLPLLMIILVQCMVRITRPLPGHAYNPDSARQRWMYEDKIRRKRITRDYQEKQAAWSRQHQLDVKAKAEADRQAWEDKKKDDAMQAAMH